MLVVVEEEEEGEDGGAVVCVVNVRERREGEGRDRDRLGVRERRETELVYRRKPRVGSALGFVRARRRRACVPWRCTSRARRRTGCARRDMWGLWSGVQLEVGKVVVVALELGGGEDCWGCGG